MKNRLLNIRLGLFIQMAALIVAVSSCTKDEATVIVPKTLDEYKKDLSLLISTEKAIAEPCVTGWNKNDFKLSNASKFTAFKAAFLKGLTDAEAILNNPAVTIKDIVAANKLIATPGKDFRTNLLVSDRRALNDSIVSCQTYIAKIVTGTLPGQVDATSKTNFNLTITAAVTTRDASTSPELQVTNMITMLFEARKKFTAAIVK